MSVIALVGGVFARHFVRRQATQVKDIVAFASLSFVAGQIDRPLLIPGSTATLVFGVISSLVGGFPILVF